MLLVGQERSRDSAALAAESRCDPIVPVVTKDDFRRVSGSYNRRDTGGRVLLRVASSRALKLLRDVRSTAAETDNCDP